MELFQVIAILVVLTAAFSYLNDRFVRLHPSVGMTVIALILSLALMVLEKAGMPIKTPVAAFLRNVNFNEALLQWMLGFLLFAGAMTVDMNELLRQRGITALLAIAGTIASMLVVGGLAWSIARLLGLGISFHGCLLFGALISPTDPVAVVSLARRMGAPKDLQTIISAESLFNDGIGVVLFLTLLGSQSGSGTMHAGAITWLFIRQTLGGAMLGFVAGIVCYALLRRVHNFQVGVLLTLALVMGGYGLGEELRVSAPIAAVMAGLLIGNQGRVLNLPADTRHDLLRFWELIEELLNAMLFVLIGLVVLLTPFTGRLLLASLLAIPIVLLARWLSVTATISVLPARGAVRHAMIPILTWGGLRGGLGIAMALSIPPGADRDPIVAITYGVVVFSIIVQGTTIPALVRRYVARIEAGVVRRVAVESKSIPRE
jgi:CPA1 family monovalent cation:H+ antiporter